MSLKGAHILVVEDDPIIARGISETLESAGALVVGPAHNLPKALRLAEDVNLSAAVLDLRLEVGDTLSVAARFEERGIQFLFQTSDPRAVLKARPDAIILSKPVAADALVLALETLLR